VRPYETMIIFDPEVEEAAIQGALDKALEVVRTNGGTTGTVDRWGRRTLAYEMNKKREGYYVVAEFSSEPKASAELDRFLVLADEVMRHKIIRLPDKVAARGPRTKPSPPSRAPATSRPERGPRSGSRGSSRDGGRGD
jgi:small subunit ribosomal protein S6